MGFFDKIKKMVGKTGVELDYTWIENPFPFGDPMIKATLRIKTGDSPVTVIGNTGTFYAKREKDDGTDEITLGEEINDVDNCASIERNGEWVNEFPETIAANSESSYGFFVDDMNLIESLKEWGVDSPDSAKIKGVKFYFKGEIDVKETVGLFDPSLEQEITVK